MPTPMNPRSPPESDQAQSTADVIERLMRHRRQLLAVPEDAHELAAATRLDACLEALRSLHCWFLASTIDFDDRRRRSAEPDRRAVLLGTTWQACTDDQRTSSGA
jgi:hypothetical protein